MGTGITLGLQHVLAMFVSNFTPAIIIGGAAGFAFGSADAVFLIQMSMLFAGIATLFQTIGFGPVGARLPVMQGTSFAFIPVMIPGSKNSWIRGPFWWYCHWRIISCIFRDYYWKNSTLVSASGFRFDNISNWYILDTSWN